MADKYLDCKELRCPMPVVKISQAMKQMSIGQTLEVEATDPTFKADIKAWTQQLGHELVEYTDGAVQRALIRKAR